MKIRKRTKKMKTEVDLGVTRFIKKQKKNRFIRPQNIISDSSKNNNASFQE